MRAAPPKPIIGEVVTVEGAEFGLLTIPKVAGSSIRAALLTSFGFELRPPEQVHRHPALQRGEYPGFVATFVRHPLDRLVSCWADRLQGSIPSIPLQRLGYRPDMTFRQFVRQVSEIGTQADVHTATQCSHLTAGPFPTFIGRFERLEDDWERLQALTGLGALPHMQRGDRGRWRDYYDEDTLGLARGLYADDLRLFGYSA